MSINANDFWAVGGTVSPPPASPVNTQPAPVSAPAAPIDYDSLQKISTNLLAAAKTAATSPHPAPGPLTPPPSRHLPVLLLALSVAFFLYKKRIIKL